LEVQEKAMIHLSGHGVVQTSGHGVVQISGHVRFSGPQVFLGGQLTFRISGHVRLTGVTRNMFLKADKVFFHLPCLQLLLPTTFLRFGQESGRLPKLLGENVTVSFEPRMVEP